MPEQSLKMYLTSIRNCQHNDSPAIVGPPANAEITYQQGEAFAMISNLLLVQTQLGSSGGQTS
jgi:hypothetical protein